VACPVCGGQTFRALREAIEIERESLRRYRFAASRLGHAPVGLEGMDLTQFMHGSPAKVMACKGCGTLHRADEPTATYESDRYDSALLRHLYPRYLQAFERKRKHYQPLLRPHAEVLEVGSHTGAFLQSAETWGWKPTGLDIGTETSKFAQRQGAAVKRLPLAEYTPRLQLFDAVFIWNCFEQLDDPRRCLSEAQRLLNRHGLVVLRVPNGDFYSQHVATDQRWFPSLGYNNLLGFPYLIGYSLGSLERLLRSSDFEPIATFATNLLTPPYPEMSARVREEWRSLEIEAEHTAPTASPWIEVVARAFAWPAVSVCRKTL
jgi:SAM-dependent methyltransferase